MTKSIMVAGCAGFIGQALCLHHLKNGDHVIGINKMPMHEDVSHNSFRSVLGAYPNFTYIGHDLTHPLSPSDFYNVRGIYNLAAKCAPEDIAEDPIGTCVNGPVITLNLLKLARSISARLVQASSSQIYGSHVYSSGRESDYGIVDPIGAQSSYIESKR